MPPVRSTTLLFRILLLCLVMVPATFAQYVDDECIVKRTGGPGVCRLISQCPSVIRDLQRRRVTHTVCGFDGLQQIVCCPETARRTTTTTTPSPIGDRIDVRISVQKCREYQSAVYEKVKLQTIIGLPPIEREVAHCAMDSVPLIVGGVETRPWEFPHMALLGYGQTDELQWACGGSLISENYVLTAGHCVFTRLGAPVTVRLGVHSLSGTYAANFTGTDQSREFPIDRNVAHPEYRASSTYNDIALVRIGRRVQFDQYMRPACLATEDDARSATRATATGWGLTAYQGERSDKLLKVGLERFSQSECSDAFRRNINRRLANGIVEETQLCAGSHTDEKDTCSGDSGGPLQIKHPDSSLYCMYSVIGVTSFGIACGTINSPGVYSRVSAYLPWIEEVVWS